MRNTIIKFAVASFFGFGSHSVAAEFSQTVKEGSVLIRMSGKIEDGDLDRLMASIKQAEEHQSPPFEGSVVLSLDSPGGSYATGLAMSKAVRSNAIGTIVKAGSECYSACALVFMHGTGMTYDMEPYVNRDMEPGARIGFHAPFLNLEASDERFEGGMVAAAYTVALRQFSDLLESGENVLSTDLLVKMLRAGPNEAVMVETYGDAMHWGIHISGMQTPKRIFQSDMYLICQNLWDDQHKRRPTATKAKPDTPEAAFEKPSGVRKRADGYEVYSYSMDDLNGISCSLGVKRDGMGNLNVVLLDMSENGERETGFERYVPLTFWHEGSEKLAPN